MSESQSLENSAVNGRAMPPFIRLMIPALLAVVMSAVALRRAGLAVDGAFNLAQLGALHPAFWVTLLTGLTGFLLAGWVWVLQPKHLPAGLFALSGLATLGFTFTTLHYFFPVPVGADTAQLFALINMYTASAFGILMCVLLCLYPSKLPGWVALTPAIILGFGGWTLWATRDPAAVGLAVQQITFAEMVLIVILALWQIFNSRNKASHRNIALWLAACIVIGSGPFIALVAMPLSLGRQPLMFEPFAFGFFNIVYIGFAIGLARFRLFDLDRWAFQLLFHAGLALLFIAVDIVLISWMAMQPGLSFAVTAIVLGAIYLPLRGWIWSRLSPQGQKDETALFEAVIATGLKPSGQERAESWLALLRGQFEPLQTTLWEPAGTGVNASSDGAMLYIPATADAPALTLLHKAKGRRLFGPKDVKLAAQLTRLIGEVEGGRHAYDRGASEERTRIAKDIHDNIGAQLLQALHSPSTARKDDMIRDTLSDLRGVINNENTGQQSLPEMLADLRAETAERAAVQNMRLIWTADNVERLSFDAPRIHALRSVIREAVSNSLKHSGASEITIGLHAIDDALRIKIGDNGRARPARDGGHGLKNMRSRVESFGGEFDMAMDESGTRISARLPAATKAKRRET